MDTLFGTDSLAYWALVALTVTITTATLGRTWKRKENHRWVTGYFILFFYGFWMVFFSHWDTKTYLDMLFGLGLAGAIKVGLEQWFNSREADKLRQQQEGPYEDAKRQV